jgi:aconitate hydratase
MFVGIRAIIVKSYARIHRSNLINFGILPLTFKDGKEFEKVEQGDQLRIEKVRDRLRANGSLTIQNVTQGRVFEVSHGLNEREIEILLAGGLLNYTRMSA